MDVVDFKIKGDKITPGYDSEISALLDQCLDDWGKPEESRKDLLPFGIRPFDMALYGMDTANGELLLIQGPEKQRKTTAVINIVVNYMTSDKPAVKPVTVIDTLESGMRPARYRDQLISNLVTRLLLTQGHRYREACPVCGTPVCRELGITPDFLRFNTRTAVQKATIDEAIEIMRAWPLRIYGASPTEGDARNLQVSVSGKEARWTRLVNEYGAKVFVTDHIQQYTFPDEPADYEKQLRSISAVSNVVAQQSIVCLMLSQVSLTSQREASAGTGKYYAAGGRKAAAEATSIFSVNYESGSGKMCITLEDSRKASSFSVWLELEDASGAFLPYREPTKGPKAQFRAGMEDGVHAGRRP